MREINKLGTNLEVRLFFERSSFEGTKENQDKILDSFMKGLDFALEDEIIARGFSLPLGFEVVIATIEEKIIPSKSDEAAVWVTTKNEYGELIGLIPITDFEILED